VILAKNPTASNLFTDTFSGTYHILTFLLYLWWMLSDALHVCVSSSFRVIVYTFCLRFHPHLMYFLYP
jgi:hypothetical protein